ncbi:minor myo-inositol transporter IolF [Desulfosarcina ovata subsp. sediminis]|uniref:Minor myo-inositol transporter IolF n=1 Tax=Desulfosarcina ovata subsp. sediminis TaxID=885957 RepID=A0A5K7ZZJ3_9BACT|nr:MFS transporter [Desulfosarcina ovata]BBO85586.1 minor myo-inositol transporter IolF [Desulfosarcina ovata subsp. sediminis]
MSTKQQSTWTKTIVASMTSYIDAGSIVAGAAGLSLWEAYLGMGSVQLGMLAAFSSNAISAALGALIGGYICDRFGRKLVYTYDLVFYMLGMLLIVFAVNFPMLFAGYCVVGLSVGADVVASWTLIAENAPAKNRAKHCGSAQVAWALGPAVVLVMSVILGGLGLLGNRIVFAHLIVVALITWILRLRMPESDSWIANKEKEQELIAKGLWRKPRMRDLFIGPNLKGVMFLFGVYTIWNLCAGTMGFFLPYIYEKVGGVSNATANALTVGLFLTSALSTLTLFMRLADRYSRRVIYCVVACLFIAAWSIFLLPEQSLTMPLLVTFAILVGINNGSGQQAFYQMWGSELFPARYRASAQGVLFFSARVFLGFWSLCLPVITESFGFKVAAIFLVAFATISMLIGTIFNPNTAGKTLEQIEAERYGSVGTSPLSVNEQTGEQPQEYMAT